MMTAAATIRPVRLDDAEPLAQYVTALFAEQLPVLFERDRVLTAEDERPFIQQHLQAPNKMLFVAELDGHIVGMLNFAAHQELQLAHSGAFGMSVARAYRGQGIGRRLLQALLDWVEQERYVRRVELQVFANNVDAVRLYEKLGFELEGRRVGAVRVAGAYTDLLDMARVWSFEVRQG